VAHWLAIMTMAGCLLGAPLQTGTKDKPSDLPILAHVLTGVAVSADRTASTAMFRDKKSGRTSVLAEGDTLEGFAILEIRADSVLLSKEGRSWRLGLEGSMAASPTGGKLPTGEEKPAAIQPAAALPAASGDVFRKTFVRAEVEKRLLEEWPVMFQETRFVPHVVDGKTQGIKLTALPKSGLLREIGLEKNDVVKEVNGRSMDKIDEFMNLYTALKSEGSFDVLLLREGRTFRLKIALI